MGTKPFLDKLQGQADSHNRGGKAGGGWGGKGDPFAKTKHRSTTGEEDSEQPKGTRLQSLLVGAGMPAPRLHPHQQLEQEKGALWSPPSSVPFQLQVKHGG